MAADKSGNNAAASGPGREPGLAHTEIYAAFKVFDTEGTGRISRELFVDILTRAAGGFAAGREQAEAIFERLDTDRNEVLSYEELADAWAVPGDWRGAMFVPLSRLRTHGSIPRRGTAEGFVHALTGAPNCKLCVPKASFDPAKTVFCFVSHRWLRPGGGLSGHPDDADNSKLALIVAFCDELRAGATSPVAPDFEVALWIDYCCIDQDTDPRFDLAHLHEIIAGCDIIFTPVVDPHHASWQYPPAVRSWLREYQAAPFLDYLSRGWCRVEMMTGSVFAVDDVSRAGLFRGAMQNALAAARRPHALFGTKELEERRSIVFLPPLLNSTFEEFAPEAGSFTVDADRETVKAMSQRARGMMVPLKLGFDARLPYVGGKGGGRGRYVYPDGSTYEGQWRAEQKHGRGVYRSVTGDVYEGEYAADEKAGRGTFRYAGGSVYEGEWMAGERNGEGTFRHVDGNVHEGRFSNDEPDGPAILRYADGGIFVGAYRASRKEGPGTYHFTDGRAEVSRFSEGRDVGEGAEFSADRQKAWRTVDGEITAEVSLEDAIGITSCLGLPVPPPHPMGRGSKVVPDEETVARRRYSFFSYAS